MEAADIAILTAAEGEDDAVREVRDGALTEWTEKTGPSGFRVWSCAFGSSSGHPLTTVLARAHEQRAESAATMATALINEYGPRCLAMSGVCAGRPGWTELGDVIIADRVYRYDAGTREGGRLTRHDISTYNLNPIWKQAAQRFALPQSAEWISGRPYTLAAQAQWFLVECRAGRDPRTSPECESRCKDWPEVLESLWARGYLSDASVLDLTPKGEAAIDRVLLLGHGSPPQRNPFKIHVGPLGTGNNLVTDDAIWDELAIQQSHIVGLDMEASAIGVVGHALSVPEVVVAKGVMDFAERARARHFRSFAARAAAEVLLAFLRRMLAARLDVHAVALGLSLHRDGADLQLWASNLGTHVIGDIEVNAVPADDDWFERTHGPLPKLTEAGSASSKLVYPITGGWFHAQIARINPGRGFMIATGKLDRHDYTKMDFDVSWNDHEGRQRKSHVVADVRAANGNLAMQPRTGF